jgi:hypothetical protein
MLYYSQAAPAFSQRCLKLAKKILAQECGILALRTRFLFHDIYYPIRILCFEHPTRWGEFDPGQYLIKIHFRAHDLLSSMQLENLIRHELAHYLTWIKYPQLSRPHGPEFKAVCREFNWGPEVMKASMPMELKEATDPNVEVIREKVKKLYGLSKSSNIHEASLAASKAQALLSKYQLQSLQKEDGPTFLARIVLESKRMNPRMQAIYQILKHCQVIPIFNYTHAGAQLVVTGTPVSVEVAVYTAQTLDRELEQIYQQEKKKNQWKGVAPRASFFRGIADGFCRQLNLGATSDQALIPLKKHLEMAHQYFYSRVRRGHENATNHQGAYNQGSSRGQDLRLPKGIEESSKHRPSQKTVLYLS